MATSEDVFNEAVGIQGLATTRVKAKALTAADDLTASYSSVDATKYFISKDLQVPRLLLYLASIDTGVTLSAAMANYTVPQVPDDLTAADTRLKVPTPAPAKLEPVDIPSLVLDSLEDATYSTYSTPPALPEFSAGRPDLEYPEAAFISVDDSADLRVIGAPELTVGATPSFLDAAPLEFNLAEIDMLDAVEPVPPELPDIELLSSPDKLAHTISQDVVDAINCGMLGEKVLEASLQHLIQKQAQTPKDIEFDRAERALVDNSAAAGFEEFTGPLIHQISELTQDFSYQDRVPYEAAREESYKRALSHVTTSLNAAIALETANAAMHFEYASKIVETLQINVALQVGYGNTLVDLFNQQVRVLRAKVAAYTQYVELSVEAYAAKIRAALSERVVLDTNAAKLTAYGAQIDTLQQQARAYGVQVQHDTQPLLEYRAYIQGLLKNVDIVRINVDAMKEALTVYGQAVDSDKAKLAAYAAQIRATGTATDVYSANWDTFSQYVTAYNAQTGAVRTWADSNLQNIRSVSSLYEAQAGAHRRYEEERKQQISRIGSLKDAYVREVAAYTQDIVNHNRTESRIDGAADEAAILDVENETREDLLTAQLVAAQTRIDLGLRTAAATAQAATAQAAQSVLSYNASYSGRATATASGSDTDSVTFSDSANRTYRFNTTRTA